MPVPRPEYDLHLDEQEATIVLQGLGELPGKVAYNLITKVAQIVAVTNQAWQTSNETQPGTPPAGLGGTPPAALMSGLREMQSQEVAASYGQPPLAQ